MRSMIAWLTLLAATIAAPCAWADADDGAAATVPVAAAPQVAGTEMPAGKPLLVIRFNQKHVYFGHALEQAVTAAERAKPGVTYDVLSFVPQADEKARTEQAANANAHAVMDEMIRLGVAQSRLHYSSQPLEGGGSQEVRIFVE